MLWLRTHPWYFLGMDQKRKVGFFGWLKRLVGLLALVAVAVGGFQVFQWYREKEILKQVVGRLTAEERVAEIWVESYQKDPDGKVAKLRLKILEYDAQGKPLKPVFCDFSVNDIIHIEAMLIRLNDSIVMDGEGKSVYLFRRAFALDDKGNTYESCEINRPMDIPGGYALESGDRTVSAVEARFWRSFWELALDEKRRAEFGVKNAQIEAPATRFLPEHIYKLILEHDGGLYIQASPVPEILKGEKVTEEPASAKPSP
jgi:hypothetical protein